MPGTAACAYMPRFGPQEYIKIKAVKCDRICLLHATWLNNRIVAIYDVVTRTSPWLSTTLPAGNLGSCAAFTKAVHNQLRSVLTLNGTFDFVTYPHYLRLYDSLILYAGRFIQLEFIILAIFGIMVLNN